MENCERPHRITRVIGAAFLRVGILVIFLSTALPRTSRHLRFPTSGRGFGLATIFRDESVIGVCRYHGRWNFNFITGSDEQLCRGQNLKPGKQILDDAHMHNGEVNACAMSEN